MKQIDPVRPVSLKERSWVYLLAGLGLVPTSTYGQEQTPPVETDRDPSAWQERTDTPDPDPAWEHLDDPQGDEVDSAWPRDQAQQDQQDVNEGAGVDETYEHDEEASDLSQPVIAPQPAQPPHPGPAFKPLRHQEDWSLLRDVDRTQTGDFWDPIKFIPLNDDGSAWLSFGGQVRLRVENWHNFGFNDFDDDTFLLTRLFFHADAHLGPNMRIYAEGKSALSTERDLAGGRRPLDADELDLQQLFGDFVLPVGQATLTFRPGRQMLAFGKQRLVSPLGWTNTMRTWDGFSAILQGQGWTVTGFWAQFVNVDKFDLNPTDAQNELAGVYATGTLPNSPIHMDLYWLALDRDETATPGGGFNGTTGIEDRDTLGGPAVGQGRGDRAGLRS